MTKAQAGRMGGRATFTKHGRGYMSEIGKRGAIRFHELYSLKPIGTSDFAIVKRENGVIIGYLNSWNWR